MIDLDLPFCRVASRADVRRRGARGGLATPFAVQLNPRSQSQPKHYAPTILPLSTALNPSQDPRYLSLRPSELTPKVPPEAKKDNGEQCCLVARASFLRSRDGGA